MGPLGTSDAGLAGSRGLGPGDSGCLQSTSHSSGTSSKPRNCISADNHLDSEQKADIGSLPPKQAGLVHKDRALRDGHRDSEMMSGRGPFAGASLTTGI